MFSNYCCLLSNIKQLKTLNKYNGPVPYILLGKNYSHSCSVLAIAYHLLYLQGRTMN